LMWTLLSLIFIHGLQLWIRKKSMDPRTKGSDRRHLPHMTVTAVIGSI